MKAAESTSMLKMTNISPSWATICGSTLIDASCCRRSPVQNPEPLMSGDRHRGGTPVCRYRAAPFADVRLELRPEVLHGGQRRGRRGVAKCAERLAGDVA